MIGHVSGVIRMSLPSLCRHVHNPVEARVKFIMREL